MALGIPPSKLKEALTDREYDAFQRYWYSGGFGERASFVRSGNQIITIMNYITGAVGGKPSKITPEDIYPQQLAFDPKKKRRQGNNAVDWDNTRPGLRKELVELGLYDEDGNPTNSRPGDNHANS